MSMLPLDVKEKILFLTQSFPSLLQKLNNFAQKLWHFFFTRDQEEHEANAKIGCVLQSFQMTGCDTFMQVEESEGDTCLYPEIISNGRMKFGIS